ncbi:F-box associated interaction domain-containing protein [Artemisia annua]|uniref:F-box associated interaction domain-containing protein n=1 Tax=Artemisia annua TaxID=35608 RepID=A0A2U1PCF5_ARTAN|nr:F-box associated interaction domain-containing protein [Artemisia annua]
MGNKKKSKKAILVLPVEIIIEILLKLPVISLLRCKSVCESWYSLISDRHFIKRHYSLSSTNINCEHHRLITIPWEQRNNLNSFPLSDLMLDINNVLELDNPLQRTQPRDLSIVGCCNGLICLFLNNDDDYNLFIYNPSTRIWNGLPFRRRKSRRGWHARYSFGYDESSDDYKVVEMSSNFEAEFKTDSRVHIYSVKTGNWKRLGDCSHAIHSNGHGKFSNGALHWLTYESLGSSFTQRIVSLDLEKETYGEVLQPEYDEGDKTLGLGVLGERLCVLCNYRESHADVWVMKVYGVKDSWSKLVSIPCQTDLGMHYISMPLCISNDGKVLLGNWWK